MAQRWQCVYVSPIGYYPTLKAGKADVRRHMRAKGQHRASMWVGQECRRVGGGARPKMRKVFECEAQQVPGRKARLVTCRRVKRR